MRKRYDWEAVQAYYDAGNDRKACMARFGFTAVAWYKAIQRGRLRATLERGKLIDWRAVQDFHDAGHSFRQCRAKFGFASFSWTMAVRRGALRPRRQRWSLDKVLSDAKARCTVKRRLIEAGILKNVCEVCGLDSWLGKPLSVQLDHRNGIRNDHRLENLRMLCPNCHSQTETYGSRNRKRTTKT